MLLCAVIFLKALYKSNAGLCAAEARVRVGFVPVPLFGPLGALTAPGALERRLLRLPKDGSARTGSPRKLEGARSQNCPPLCLNYLFRSISVLFGVVELYIEAVSISSAARRDCAEI